MKTHYGAHLPGRDEAGEWISPTDLRCVGGPADGKWFAVPPEGYSRIEARGGAFWLHGSSVRTLTNLYGTPCY